MSCPWVVVYCFIEATLEWCVVLVLSFFINPIGASGTSAGSVLFIEETLE